MAKILIEESDTIDAKSLETLKSVARFFDRMEDPYRMPDLMSDWLTDYNSLQKVDTFYQIPVGYGGNSLSLSFMFKKGLIIMTFMLPDGTRLMELRLHE